MGAQNLKGSLLEFIIRRLLMNCGFTKVKEDGLLVYKKGGLTMINGKGAAHDADVLMNPPIQMPFSYPYRLNFECKAHNKTTGLSIIRNALGLRNDLNDFEIVTKENLESRKNNSRSSVAIDNRQRYNYQIGIASVEDFTKPAFEFAANNKIPLISLKWFLPDNICSKFHEIDDTYLNQFSRQQLTDLGHYLKGNSNRNGERFIKNTESLFKEIYASVLEFENRVLIGLLESGDMLFLVSRNGSRGFDYFSDRYVLPNARFHYSRRELDYWILSIDHEVEFGFYLPRTIMEMWRNQNFDGRSAIDIKNEMFSKVFLFIRDRELPFRILRIDSDWLDEIRR